MTMTNTNKCVGCNNPPKTKKGWCSHFHKKYGFQWATKEKWDNYVKETFGEIPCRL